MPAVNLLLVNKRQLLPLRTRGLRKSRRLISRLQVASHELRCLSLSRGLTEGICLCFPQRHHVGWFPFRQRPAQNFPGDGPPPQEAPNQDPNNNLQVQASLPCHTPSPFRLMVCHVLRLSVSWFQKKFILTASIFKTLTILYRHMAAGIFACVMIGDRGVGPRFENKSYVTVHLTITMESADDSHSDRLGT